MSVGITSCWHLQGHRLQERLYWVEQALRRMKADGVTAVLHCGDVFHYGRVGSPDAPASTVVGALREVVAGVGLPIFMAEGNHDQCDAPHRSALALLDGAPYFAHMGGHQWFELPRMDTALVALDWTPAQSLPDWLAALKRRLAAAVEACGHVLVFGHVDPLEVSHGSGAWPRPSFRDLEGLFPDVWWFLGHNHGARMLSPRVRVVGALSRLRWDEAENVDGWYEVCGDMEISRHALNGPRFLTEFNSLDKDGLRRGDEIRLPLPDPWFSNAATLAGARVTVVPPPTERARKAVVGAAGVHPGATVAEALQAWLQHAGRAELAGACLTELRSLESAEKSYQGRGVTVAEVAAVVVCEHVAHNGAQAGASFDPGWNVLLGESGSGKTTLLESIFAALFGYWPTPGRRDMWSGFVGADPVVKVQLRTTDGEAVEVHRGRLKDDPFIKLFCDGRQVTDKVQPTKVQPYVCSLVGNGEAWLRSCFLSQDPQLDLVESGPADRLAAVQRMLGLDEVETAAKQVLELYRKVDLEKARRDAELAEAATLETEAVHCTTQAALVQMNLDDHRDELRREEAKLDALRKRASVHALAAEIRRLETEVAGLPPVEKMKEAQVIALKAARRLEDAAAAVRRRDDLQDAEEAGTKADQRLLKVGCAANLLPCPLIDQAVKDRDKGLLAAAERVECCAGANKEWNAAVKADTEAKTALRKVEEACVGARAANANLQRLRVALDGQTPEELTPTDQAELVYLEGYMPKLRSSVEDTRAQLVRFNTQAEEKQKRAAALRKVAAGRTQADKQPALATMAEAFSRTGIPRMLVEQAVPGLQAEVDNLLASPGMEWLRLEIDYKNPDDPKAVPVPLASVRGGPWVDARLLSGGQRAAARLVVRLASCAWAAAATPGSILILDEPTAHMGEELAQAAAEMLRSLVGSGRPFSQGILATHDEVLALTVGGKVQRL